VCAAAARHLLVVYHSRSGGTQALADAAIAGATSDEVDGVEVRVRPAFDATVDDVVKGGHDGEGAVRSVERIVTGLAWKSVLAPVLVVGEIDDAALEQCHELGITFAAGLEAGVF
jgi:hypothetical protein